jgi:hypothetical protein
MLDYLKLIINPAIYLDKVGGKKHNDLTTTMIWIVAIVSLTLPKIVIDFKTSKLGYAIFIVYALAFVILYFLMVYGMCYLYWIVGKGFKGVSRFIEIRHSFIYSLIPFIICLPFSLTYVITGLLKGDNELIVHENYITQIILSILSFRIFIIGIAKFNKFNWTIALFNWFIVGFVITGLIYLFRH